MLDLQLYSIWEGHKPKGTYVNWHSHKYFELVYYPLGRGKTNIGEHTYTFSDNCFAMIPPHVSHDEYHLADSKVICLVFSGCPPFPQVFRRDFCNAVHKLLQDMLCEARTQKYGYKDMINLRLNELYLYVLRNENKGEREKNFDYIIHYIKENFHEKIILADCARQLNLSYDYFQHKFKALTGFSPRQFLLMQRLAASEKMLAAGNLSCTKIAYLCGFSSSAQYSAIFKREYGLTPLQFRKNHVKRLQA